jgi:hypothetical protein
MGQRIPTRDQPSVSEVESYVLEMVTMLTRLADDADLRDLANRLRTVPLKTTRRRPMDNVLVQSR